MIPTCASPSPHCVNASALASRPPRWAKKAYWLGMERASTTHPRSAWRRLTPRAQETFFTPASFSASCRAVRCSASSTSPVPPPPSTAPPSAPAVGSSPSPQSSTSSPPAHAPLPLASPRSTQLLPQLHPPPTHLLSCH